MPPREFQEPSQVAGAEPGGHPLGHRVEGWPCNRHRSHRGLGLRPPDLTSGSRTWAPSGSHAVSNYIYNVAGIISGQHDDDQGLAYSGHPCVVIGTEMRDILIQMPGTPMTASGS